MLQQQPEQARPESLNPLVQVRAALRLTPVESSILRSRVDAAGAQLAHLCTKGKRLLCDCTSPIGPGADSSHAHPCSVAAPFFRSWAGC